MASGILLAGSRRRQPRDSKRLSTAPASNEVIQVTVVLTPASGAGARRKAIQHLGSRLPIHRKHLSPRAFLQKHGARVEHVDAVKKFAKDHGLKVVESSRAKRCVVLSGPMDAFAHAFSVEFAMHEVHGEVYRSYDNGVRLPSSMHPAVEAVLGLENRALMNHHTFHRAQSSENHLNPADIAAAYSFPAEATGKGQRIAIIELGGGFLQKDVDQYFQQQNVPVRKIPVVELQGQKNSPSSTENIKKMLDAMGVLPTAASSTQDRSDAIQALWTIEATFDIELAGSFAPEAEIVVYFAPNNEQGKYHAIASALSDTNYPPTIISCSWGAVEDGLPQDFVSSMDQQFQDAALKGVTICFSSGDRGDDPDQTSGQPRVHFPASSPHVLSCGGTHWVDPASCKKEVVWSEQLPTAMALSGGGVSKIFDCPDWQSSADVEKKTKRKGRGVPDVAGKADVVAGYCLIVGGYDATMGGTSAAAPMWAGLLALLNQQLGNNIGYLTPLLYRKDFTQVARDITEGNNGKYYRAEPGWDACTGIGTPHGTNLLSALKKKGTKN